MNNTTETFIYVSIGSEPTDLPNVFQSNLIFHHVQPEQLTGRLSSGKDVFDDFTIPCPKECDTTSVR